MEKTIRKFFEVSYFVISFLITSFAVPAQTTVIKLDEPRDLTYQQRAFNDLLETKTFTLAGFGYAARPFRSTSSLIQVLSEKESEKVLVEIIRKANPEGQIYALIGLQVINSKFFDNEFEFVQQQLKEKGVTHISSSGGGCIPATNTIKTEEVLNIIRSKEYAKIFSRRYMSN